MTGESIPNYRLYVFLCHFAGRSADCQDPTLAGMVGGDVPGVECWAPYETSPRGDPTGGGWLGTCDGMLMGYGWRVASELCCVGSLRGAPY